MRTKVIARSSLRVFAKIMDCVKHGNEAVVSGSHGQSADDSSSGEGKSRDASSAQRPREQRPQQRPLPEPGPEGPSLGDSKTLGRPMFTGCGAKWRDWNEVFRSCTELVDTTLTHTEPTDPSYLMNTAITDEPTKAAFLDGSETEKGCELCGQW